MKLILEPHWIAEHCFLQEALMWAGFYRYPKSEIIPDRVDDRFSKDQVEYEPMIVNNHSYVESDEAVRIGLQPNPEWEELLTEDESSDAFLYSDAAHIERMLTLKELEGDERKKYEKALPAAKERQKEQEEWDASYEEYIEIIEAKLFVALKEGRLQAHGKAVTLKKDDNDDEYENYEEHEEIPKKHWRQDGIIWNASASKNKTGHYCHIYVETDQLFELFPPPDAEETKPISVIAGQYVIDEDDTEKVKIAHRKGRPSYDWPSLYLELTDRLQKGNIPTKQEAFIAEMQEWCFTHWGRKVGRSTLLEKISPFYKKYVTK